MAGNVPHQACVPGTAFTQPDNEMLAALPLACARQINSLHRQKEMLEQLMARQTPSTQVLPRFLSEGGRGWPAHRRPRS